MDEKLEREIHKAADTLRTLGRSLTPVALAKALRGIDLPIPASTLALLISTLPHSRINFIPQFLVDVIRELVRDKTARVVCDPWARFGVVVAAIQETISPEVALAFTPSVDDAAVGHAIGNTVQWQVGEPIQLLAALSEINIACSVLPFGLRSQRPLTLTDTGGNTHDLRDDVGNLILIAASNKLAVDGVGIFVVPQSFFFSQHSVFRKFDALGLGIEAALELPSGAFAPLTNISTYLVVVRKRLLSKMFVAQLSSDSNTNLQIITNLQEGVEGGTLELGRFVDPLSFFGLDLLRMVERFKQARDHFGVPATPLEKLATAINLGRSNEEFKFPQQENAIFIPIIGRSDVVDSVDELTLKPQKYAQVVIEPSRSNARFVARFFNSELGKEIRELNKTGGVIPKLNKQKLQKLQVFVPDLQTQRTIIEIETRIATEHNTLLGLQNDIAELRRDLWANPRSASKVDQRLISLSNRLSGSLKQHAVERLDQWFETLPFPLASILRAWQATPNQDFYLKHLRLLDFFEATAEFHSVILLSAFKSNEGLFESHRQKLTDALKNGKVSFQQASFGTWKVVVEYFGKQTRQLLSGDTAARALCANIFSDPSLALPDALSRKELSGVLSTTNKMRNDWKGHGSVVGDEDARLRNEQLVGELQKLREAIADTWTETQLIHLVRGDLHRGLWVNEIALLMGSNSPFLTETRSMSMPLEKDDLYLAPREGAGQALRLLPLVQVGPSPQSARNACYFFSRLERDGAKFVSYHFTDKPELTGQFGEATAAIKFLTEI
jgi:hypothetical protein